MPIHEFRSSAPRREARHNPNPFGWMAIDQKDQKSIGTNPNVRNSRKPLRIYMTCCRALHCIPTLRPARALELPMDCRPWAQAYSLFTMSIWLPAFGRHSRRKALSRSERKLFAGRVLRQAPTRRSLQHGCNGLAGSERRWWSQTGSNRRPQACKASALPTELWPRTCWLHLAGSATVRKNPRWLVGGPGKI